MAEKYKKLKELLEEIRRMPAFNPPGRQRETPQTQPQAQIQAAGKVSGGASAGITAGATVERRVPGKYTKLVRILNEIRQMPAFNPHATELLSGGIGSTSTGARINASANLAARVEAAPTPKTTETTTPPTPRATSTTRRALSEVDRKFREEVRRNQERFALQQKMEQGRRTFERFIPKISRMEGQAIEAEPTAEAKTVVPLTNLQELKKMIALPFGEYKASAKYYYLPSYNPGITIRTEEGAAVKPVAPGVVLVARNLRGYGGTVLVEHDDGTIGLYAGLNPIAVKPGQQVTPDDIIGQVRTGSGLHGGIEAELLPYLQFEIHAFDKKGRLYQINPIQYLQRLGVM